MTDTLPTIDPQRARKVVDERVAPTWPAAKAFFDGDHYQGGAGWIGAHLDSTTPAEATRFESLIARAFISSNVGREGVVRHRSAVVGREPMWRYTPTRALADGEEPDATESGLISEGEAAVTAWWNRVEAVKKAQEAVDWSLLGASGCLRLYIPQGGLDEQGRLNASDLPSALARIELEALTPDRACVAKDARTGRDVSVVKVPKVAGLFEDAEQGEGDVEVVLLVDGAAEGEPPLTQVIVLGEGGQTAGDPLPLGGRLTVAAIERPVLLTTQLMQLQRALNHSLTMMERNQDQAGSAEEWATGAKMPNLEWSDEANDWIDNGQPLQTGPGTINFLSGIPIYDAQGNVINYTTPQVKRIDPVSPVTFTATQDALYARMLGEMDQRHALISGDATVSGESRIQARAEFVASLRPTASAVEGALRSILDAVLAWASAAIGQPGRFALIRADVTCRIDAGPLTSDERRLIIEQQAAGLLSEETAMALLGVDDVDAEAAKIAEERAERQARAPQVLSTTAEAVLPTAPVEEPSEEGVVA